MDKQRPEAVRGKSLHAMTTEQLEELLRHEQDADREPDVDLIEDILAVLDDRTEAPQVDVEAAWEDFKENYISGEPLYPIPDDTPARPAPARKRPWLRIAVVAAVLVAVILGMSVTASASGFNLWNVFIKWTSETFGIEFEEREQAYPEMNSELSELMYAVSQTNPGLFLVPHYLPEGYTQTGLIVADDEITACYGNESNYILIQYKRIHGDAGSIFQRDRNTSEEYQEDGITHYLSTNMGNNLALWVNEDWECNIMGVLSKQELIRMIDSIYSGG